MIILDTNVVSEGFRARPNVAVRQWLDAQAPDDLYLCAPVIAEIRYGIARLNAGEQQERLRAIADKFEDDLYKGRILPFDTSAASVYGRIAAERRRKGKPVDPMDGMIAAIAIARGAAVATRDRYGFSDLDLTIIDPFQFQR
ncbi:MAG TPA: type II toxin-antitoxin system VapC family toxin [Bradyrhizobium sp.]|nr:type II toxin-antitoxin system VapC family toxin [Bradyrhizobium sp.]